VPSANPRRDATSAFSQTSFSAIISLRIGFDCVRPNVCTGARPNSSLNMPGGGSAGLEYFGTGRTPVAEGRRVELDLPDAVGNSGATPSSK